MKKGLIINQFSSLHKIISDLVLDRLKNVIIINKFIYKETTLILLPKSRNNGIKYKNIFFFIQK